MPPGNTGVPTRWETLASWVASLAAEASRRERALVRSCPWREQRVRVLGLYVVHAEAGLGATGDLPWGGAGSHANSRQPPHRGSRCPGLLPTMRGLRGIKDDGPTYAVRRRAKVSGRGKPPGKYAAGAAPYAGLRVWEPLASLCPRCVYLRGRSAPDDVSHSAAVWRGQAADGNSGARPRAARGDASHQLRWRDGQRPCGQR